jgi:hypothetical protein
MESEKDIYRKVEKLQRKGDWVLSRTERDPYDPMGRPNLDYGAFVGWQTQCLSFLTRLLRKGDPYLEGFRSAVTGPYPSHVSAGLEILRALREDIEGGYFRSFRALVQADLFADFLEMAQHLLENQYKDPAALLTGAVLEEGLRQIALAKGLTVKDKDNLSSLNQRSADAEVYDRLTQKKLEVWIQIRNNAAHGKFNEYGEQDVREMLEGVRAFLAAYLGRAP